MYHLFDNLHHNSQSLLIIFRHWTQPSEYWGSHKSALAAMWIAGSYDMLIQNLKKFHIYCGRNARNAMHVTQSSNSRIAALEDCGIAGVYTGVPQRVPGLS